MSKRQLVLVAVDHATDMERTMDVALRVAEARDADVHAIHVVSHRAVPVDDRTGRSTLHPRGHRGAAPDGGPASISTSADHVRVRSVTLRGKPGRVLPAYAQLHRATLVVVERDFGSSQFWRNGRVVDGFARLSPVPLLVLPRRLRHEREEPGLRRIVTAVDSSIASAVALRTALDLSRRHAARVTLVHAMKYGPQHMVFSGSEAWEAVRRLPGQVEAVAERLRRKAALLGADDVDAEVATGAAAGAIVEIATRSDAGLVVMGIAHRSWLDRLMFGSTVRSVLRRATVPVLVVPVYAGAQAWPNEPAVGQVSGRLWTEPVADRVAA